MWSYNYTNTLAHHGIKGMKWGKRRYQNQDGSLTPAGQKRYGSVDSAKQALNKAKADKKAANKKFNKAYRDANSWILNSQFDKADNRRRDTSMMNAAKKANDADNAYKKAKQNYKQAKKQFKMDEKTAKMQHKDFVKTRSKEILAGESFAGKVWDRLTDAHKYQAEIEYNLREQDKKKK